MKHTACEQLMVASFYDELAPDVRGQFRTHLDGCASCKEKFDRLTTTLRRMEQRQRHEPDEAYWNGYWARLEPALCSETRQQKQWGDWIGRLWRGVAIRPRLAYSVVSAVTLVGIGMILGRFFMQPDSTPVRASNEAQSISSKVEDVKRAGQYLDRSRTLLLGIINIDTADVGKTGVDLSKQRAVSRELVNEGRVLETSLNSPDQAQLRMLVSELEVLMMQIANLEARNNSPAIQIVRNGVERSAILLKINLEQMQMDTPDEKSEKPNS